MNFTSIDPDDDVDVHDGYEAPGNSDRMESCWGKVFGVFLVVALIVCRLNLPKESVQESFLMAVQPKDANRCMTFAIGVLSRNETIRNLTAEWANWKETDWVIVKWAKSERMGITGVALPFLGWQFASTGHHTNTDQPRRQRK